MVKIVSKFQKYIKTKITIDSRENGLLIKYQKTIKVIFLNYILSGVVRAEKACPRLRTRKDLQNYL